MRWQVQSLGHGDSDKERGEEGGGWQVGWVVQGWMDERMDDGQMDG